MTQWYVLFSDVHSLFVKYFTEKCEHYSCHLKVAKKFESVNEVKRFITKWKLNRKDFTILGVTK